MSSIGLPETSTTHGQPATAEPTVSRKSYRYSGSLSLSLGHIAHCSPCNRRKYRKIMVTFEEETKESNNLFREEQRINDISQRLAEQTE